MTKSRDRAIDTLIDISAEIASRGWLRATSGNLSIRDSETDCIYITQSGSNKAHLTFADILTLDALGTIIEGWKPSFETAIHRTIYQHTEARAVFHIHTVHNNVASKYAEEHHLLFHDHEMLKALGHWEEGASIRLPVVPNHADMSTLARAVEQQLNPTVPAVLIRRHGIYAFGESPEAALRHLEAFEFLFEWLTLERLTDSIVAAHQTLSI